eukprot:COSAG06_NODE_52758_length_304_cov_0.492683_1_plen_39_part_01
MTTTVQYYGTVNISTFSWARSTPYPRQEPETQLDDSEMI